MTAQLSARERDAILEFGRKESSVGVDRSAMLKLIRRGLVEIRSRGRLELTDIGRDAYEELAGLSGTAHGRTVSG